jgi:oligo-1,6-glucosidase
MKVTHKWWKEAIMYQIYPRSFKDSNGDGMGDLEGVISKLDYLAKLGVDIIWICPFFDSPNDDNGYDVRNYYAIGREFGDMPIFDRLLEEMHSRGMKLMVDLVLNHTSDEHEWFVQSRSSKDSPFRDYYFWEETENKEPPTNWPSFFAGNVWQYDEHTKEYYLHIFSKKQPDLNWENPKVRDEMSKIVNFWIDKGVDGFRLDVIPLISKRLPFKNTDLTRFNDIVQEVYSNGPKVHEYIREMAQKSFSRADVVTVGEGPGITTETGPLYVNEDRGELNMIFHLDHMFLGYGLEGRFDPVPYDLVDIKRIISKWDMAMGDKGWISIFMDNHDFPRMVSRFGNDKKYRKESAGLLAVMVLTLRGTPCIYQGSEIAMANVEYDSIEDFDDVETKNFYRQMKEQGIGEEEFRRLANTYGRDNARTPMQWTAGENAGFSTAKPWLKVNPDHVEWNVEAALEYPDSVFYFYQKMIAFRKENPVFTYGEYEDLAPDDGKIFIYRRWQDDVQFLVMLNFSDETQEYQFDTPIKGIAIDNYKENIITGKLKPWQALVVEME